MNIDEMKRQISDLFLDLGASGAYILEADGSLTPLLSDDDMKAAQDRKKQS